MSNAPPTLRAGFSRLGARPRLAPYFYHVPLALPAFCAGAAHRRAPPAAPLEGTLRMTLSDGRSAPLPLTYRVKGDKLRTEMAMQGMALVAIMDTAKNEMIMLMPGQPISMATPLQEAANQVAGKSATDAPSISPAKPRPF